MNAVYSARYRASHRAERATYNAAYYASHVEERRAYKAAHYTTNKEQWRTYYAAHRDEKIADNCARNAARKLAALNAYGGPVCACCGETLLEGLTIDHINGDGARHRRETGVGANKTLYWWLEKNNYPPGFQVLCMTCNFAKRSRACCPHEETRAATVFAPY